VKTNIALNIFSPSILYGLVFTEQEQGYLQLQIWLLLDIIFLFWQFVIYTPQLWREISDSKIVRFGLQSQGILW